MEVDLGPAYAACLARGFLGAGGRNIPEPTQTDVAPLVADLNTQNPTASAALVDLKRQACNAADEFR